MFKTNYTVLFFNGYDCPHFIDVDTFSEAKQIAREHKYATIYNNKTDALMDADGNVTEW